jgi:AraC-like DNA-binding protein
MLPTFSQESFWSLVKRPSETQLSESWPNSEGFEQVWAYPEKFGQGAYREIQIRPGLMVEISDYQHHTPLVVECSDRAHPIELHFDVYDEAAQRPHKTAQYWVYSSGLAPAKHIHYQSHPRCLSLSLHIEPEIFRTLLGHTSVPPNFGSLLKAADEPYSSHRGSTSPAIAMILQQILNCPYSGGIRKLFLEGKVLELMAISLQSAFSQEPNPGHNLKADDIDRIRQARDILLCDLANPPSLLKLAHQVGLNDCTLKRGFRQVFNTTVFGYLQTQRLERARLLLLERELSVQQAAHAVGYLSRSHFSAAFRKHFGVSPREMLVRDRGG